jgi:C-terminal processing protease CtpA/Prc
MVHFGDLGNAENQAAVAHWLERSRRTNFGFEKVERLTGNIGYIDLRGFALPEYAGETAVAAMGFVANCDALIFDLRKNYGGESEMLQLLISYLYSPELKHLNTIYSRPEDEHWQFWTLPYVPGKRLPDIPVYVLTSKATFSGAEEFAYDLKHMGRATIIGEITGGGGHMVDLAIIQDNFQVLFPFAGAIHPITRKSWEGTGVEPDIHVPQAEALKNAHLKAMDDLIEACTDDQRKSALLWELEIIQSTYDPVLVDDVTLNRYTGQYGKRSFIPESGKLHYISPGSSSLELTPLTATRFRRDEDIKFEFFIDEHNTAQSVVITYQDDRPEIKIDRSK